MIEIKLGTRYARSIMALATEQGQLEQVVQDFRMIHQVCTQNREFRYMLRSPLIYSDKKQEIMDALFGKKFSSKITAEFIPIVIRKRREAFLKDIADRVMFIYDEKKNITRGIVTTAMKLSEGQREQIRKIVQDDLKTKFEIEERIDPALIGGFTLLVGDRKFDGSIANRLRDLEREFESNPYIRIT